MDNPATTGGSTVWRYFGLVLAGTSALHLSIVALGLPFRLDLASPSLYLYLAGLAMPSIVAWALTPAGRRWEFIGRLGTSGGGTLELGLAVAAPFVWIAAAWLVAQLTDAATAGHFQFQPATMLVLLGQIYVVAAEEPGWRGFALPRLLGSTSPRRATLILAGVWGVWHAPMFMVPGSLQASSPLALFGASILAWSSVHTWLYMRGRPGIRLNLVFHASANMALNLGLTPPEILPALTGVYLLAAGAVMLWLPGDSRA